MVDDQWKGVSLLEGRRRYLGISTIGHKCDRCLWLDFHWADREVKKGSLERLLERGAQEEANIVSNLRSVGVELDYVLDKQAEFDFGCFVKGHPDGLILEGVPEAPKAMHNLEMKTSNRKAFEEIVAKGCEAAKPMHYRQQMCEMYGWKHLLKKPVERSVYYVVCKDNDENYSERITLDEELAEALIKRGQELCIRYDLPKGLSSDPSWWECKMCSHYGLCHEKKLPEVNCRTCAFFDAHGDTSTCHCLANDDKEIPDEDIAPFGCEWHVLNPSLASLAGWEYDEKNSTDYTARFFIGGLGWIDNGYGGMTTDDIIKKLSAKSS